MILKACCLFYYRALRLSTKIGHSFPIPTKQSPNNFFFSLLECTQSYQSGIFFAAWLSCVYSASLSAVLASIACAPFSPQVSNILPAWPDPRTLQ